MTSRKPIAIALATSAIYAGFVASAQAEMHYVRVTLVTGQQLTITVDVPPGTPVDQLQIPGLPAPVSSIVDLGSVESTPSPTAVAPPTVTIQPTATATPTPAPSASATPDAGTGSQTGSAPEKTKKKVDKTTDKTANTVDKAANQATGGANTESLTGKVPVPTPTPVPDDQAQPPKPNDPTYSLAEPGAARVGVPNFFIDKFKIPPFLLPIYQAAGTEYGIRWELLAAINEIETDYGRNLNVSSAGARGWMQFMPGTWKDYGVDGNHDGYADPDNPVDAIFAAARYLKAAGADKDIRGAVFAYNHADWYVDSVLLRAQVIGGLPANLVSSLTGLTEGRFPVAAKATYADEISKGKLRTRKKNPALAVESATNRHGLSIYAGAGSPVIAVSDSRVVKIGVSKRLGNFIQIQDAYGNTYTYARLAKISRLYAAPKPQEVDPAEVKRMLALPRKDSKPTEAASSTDRPASHAQAEAEPKSTDPALDVSQPAVKERLFAHPARSNAAAAGGAQQEFLRTGRIDGALTPARALNLARDQIVIRHLKAGAQIPAGTVLGRIGRASSIKHPHLRFEIRPAGRGAPRIDPKPILDGWKLLESTAIYRAKGENPFVGPNAAAPTIGQVLLMSKETLMQRVLADPRVQIYDCGRRDIQAGAIDRRVLATLEFLVASGFDPTVTSLHCGHSYLTASGNVSEHTSGTAVDIAAVNGIPILGHQGKGSITDLVIQRLLTLQGAMKPHQIISLMTFDGADNTLSLPDHDDHIHVGFRPLYGPNDTLSKQLNAVLRPSQWDRLIERLGQIANPTVPLTPSKGAFKVDQTDSPQIHPTQDRRFGFVQWEFAGRLGPPLGRYVVRRFAGDDVRQVVVVTEGGAPRRRARRERAESVPVTRMTVIHAAPLSDDVVGWLARAVVTDEALGALTALMSAHRVAAADPFAVDADVRRALHVRVGYGSGEQVAAGEWTEARELPVPEIVPARRRSRNRPVDRLAALLAARDVALACEDLALRARLDLGAGRDRQAALQLEAALSAALAELAGWVGSGDLGVRVAELTELQPSVVDAAVAAREGRLEAAGVEAVTTALVRLEAALRARAIYAAESL